MKTNNQGLSSHSSNPATGVSSGAKTIESSAIHASAKMIQNKSGPVNFRMLELALVAAYAKLK